MTIEFLSEAEIDDLAHKRAASRMGWYLHVAIYVTVNLALYAGAALMGRQWVIAPLLAWGLGLAIHGLAVWMAMPGARLYQHLLRRELVRLQPQRDPW